MYQGMPFCVYVRTILLIVAAVLHIYVNGDRLVEYYEHLLCHRNIIYEKNHTQVHSHTQRDRYTYNFIHMQYGKKIDDSMID